MRAIEEHQQGRCCRMIILRCCRSGELRCYTETRASSQRGAPLVLLHSTRLGRSIQHRFTLPSCVGSNCVRHHSHSPPLGIQHEGFHQQTDRVSMGLHHLLCWWLHGSPPAGKTLACHNTCGSRGCINTKHISWGDQADNALQAIAHRTIAKRARGSVQPATTSVVTSTQQIGAKQKRNRVTKGSRFD